jgi:hypothetical protein
MMAVHRDRPLVDGENEYITLTAIAPVFKGRQHLHPDYWQAEGRLDGVLMRLTVIHEDRRLFVEAGYVASEVLKNIATTVSIEVRTMLDDRNRWRVAEVVSRDENAVVHTEAERHADYLADLQAFGGKFTRLGATELQFSTSARWVNWSVDGNGRYVRLASTGERTLYAAKAVQS